MTQNRVFLLSFRGSPCDREECVSVSTGVEIGGRSRRLNVEKSRENWSFLISRGSIVVGHSIVSGFVGKGVRSIRHAAASKAKRK